MQMWEHHQSQDNEDYIQNISMKICNSNPSQPLVYFLSSEYFLKFYVNGIIVLVLFLSMSTVIWRIIHAAACSNSLFIFIPIST